jgi:hypothetical protein
MGSNRDKDSLELIFDGSSVTVMARIFYSLVSMGRECDPSGFARAVSPSARPTGSQSPGKAPELGFDLVATQGAMA